MKSKIKDYKSNEIEKTFDQKKIFFFFHAGNLKSRDYIKIEQKLNQNNFEIHRIKNNLLKTKNIINATSLIYSTISTGYIESFNVSFADYLTKLFKFRKDLIFISIIYNNKLYLPAEVISINESSTHLNIILCLLNPYKKFMLVPLHEELNAAKEDLC
jgi:hypothetical protein